MSDKNLDDQIRDAIGDFKAEFEPGSWDLLSERMAADPELNDQVEAEEVFDQAVKTKINNIEPAYQAEHWKIMAERIQQEFSLRRRLIRYKVAEVGMVLLIIFTLFNTVPGGKTNFKQKVQDLKEQIASIRYSASHKGQKIADITPTVSTKSSASNKENVLIKNDALGKTQNIEDTLVFTENKSNQANEKKSQLKEIPVLNSRKVKIFSVSKETFAFAETQSIINTDDVTSEEVKSGIAKIGEKIRSLFGNKNETVESLQKLEDSAISAIEYETDTAPDGQSNATDPIKSNFLMRVAMIAGSDYNYIETPYDPIFDLDRNNRFVPGYQAGIALSFRTGNLEIETGGIYAKKEYDPGIPTEFIDNLNGPPIAVVFDNIQLNMLEIPLNFRFHFGKSDKWRFYGQTGASVHMALVANYDKFPANLDAVFAAAPQESQPKLESKKFADGLLEGGSFSENSYFTLNLGLGAERLISSRWSLFFQPSVKAYMLPTYNNGLGPNRDRISSISFLTGARVSLW